MSIREAIRMALGMIRANKLRAFFTVLGTVVGVTFLLAVITIINGMDVYMKRDFAAKIFGYNTVTVARIPDVQTGPVDRATWQEWHRRPRLSFEDAEWLAGKMETSGTLAYSSGGAAKVSNSHGRTVSGVMLTGASASYFQIRDLQFAEGRPFSEAEARAGTPVAVIGADVAKTLFEGSPVGRTVRINKFPFRVVGVLADQGEIFGMSLNKQALAPIRSALNGQSYGYNVADNISFKVPDASLVPVAMSELEGLMRIRHHRRPEQKNDFELQTADAAIGFWNTISSFMLKVLPMLIGISLIVGAVVIMNIMLVSVSERTREIGVRKSLGARRRDILLQFLIEAGTLSGAGGLLGVALGIGMAWLVAALSPMPASVSTGSVVMGLSLGIG
ncbi:MAG TPA: ABC transporter permease, partial [Longimicrobiaceae bacterium]|nr:ABC transporter permease [Longimicrobiaceae bacterium]